MKTFYLAIITGAGIGGGIFLIFSHMSLYPLNIPNSASGSYTSFDAVGLQNTYHVGDTANFTLVIKGHGMVLCITPEMRIYNDLAPDKPILDVKSATMSCPVQTQPQDFQLYFPSKTSSFTMTLNQTGSYTLEISYGGRTILDSFTVISPENDDFSDDGKHSIGNATFEIPSDKKIPSYFCANQEYYSSGNDVFLICRHVSNSTSNAFNLPDPEYKYTGCGGCALGFAYVPQIPANLLSDEKKQQVIDKVLEVTGLKTRYPDIVLDHFLIQARADHWFADVQFVIPHIMNGYGHCGWYTASDVDLDTLQISPSDIPIGNSRC